MIKRSAALVATLGALCAGVIAAAPIASADSSAESCRSWEINSSGHAIGWVGEPGGVTLDSCWLIDTSIPDAPWAEIGYTTQAAGIDPCAQLVDVTAGGTWAHNYGCAGWTKADQGETYIPMNPAADLALTHGHKYVIQVGYWADLGSGLKYYGNVQSPVYNY